MADRTMSEWQWDRLLESIDTLDNLTTALTVMKTLSPSLHVEALRESLPRLLDKMTSIVREVDPEALSI